MDVQLSIVMPSRRAVPLTFRAIRLILDRNEELGSGSTLPPTVIRALETALRGSSLVGGDCYHVALTPDDVTTLVAWCREAAEGSTPRDAAVLRVSAAVIGVAP